MKGVEKNGEINRELQAESSEKGKKEKEIQQDLQKVELTKWKQHQVEETKVQKEYHNISQNIISKRMESKMTCNKITFDISSNVQESISQVKP